MTCEDQVQKLAHQPLVLATLRAIAEASSPVTPSALSKGLSKLEPNIAHALRNLRNTGLVEVKPKGRMRLYQIPCSKKAEVQLMIEQAMLKQTSSELAERQRIHLTKRFYQDIIRRALMKALPNGCHIATNEKIKLNNSQLDLSTVISMNDGTRIGVELNVGPPGNHFYSTIGKALTFKAANLVLMIVVLLAPNSRDYNLPRLISAGSGSPASFGFVCEDMPLKSAPVFGEETARKIMDMIKNETTSQEIGSV